MRLSGAVFEVTFCERIAPDGGKLRLATKRVSMRLRTAPEARAALVREAGFLSLARNPALPALFEVGADTEGAFIVEEWVDGLSLDAVLERSTGALPYHFAAHIVASAASTLRALHTASDAAGSLALAHGDPSPSNVLVSEAGQVRFVDFGASRFRGVARPLECASGTPPYAAPELCRGEVDVSPETDVYALGAVAIRLFTGEQLTREMDLASRLIEIAERGIDLAPLTRARIPAPLRLALEELVAFRRDDRRVDLDALLEALDPLASAPT